VNSRTKVERAARLSLAGLSFERYRERDIRADSIKKLIRVLLSGYMATSHINIARKRCLPCRVMRVP
jgi:hypothetical protein